MKRIMIMSLTLVLMIATSAYAIPVTYNFSGYIDSVQIRDTSSPVGSKVSNIVAYGSHFNGIFSYDTSAAPISSGSTYAFYPASDFSVTIDSIYSFTSASPEAFVLNNNSCCDRFGMHETTGSDISSNITADYMYLALTDGTDTVFSDTSLPVSLNLSDFGGWNGIIISNNSSSGLGSTSDSYIVSGIITSITPVPEPSTLILLGIGLMILLTLQGRTTLSP